MRDIEHHVTLTFEEAVHLILLPVKFPADGDEQTIDVQIPAGVSDGSRVRIKARGNLVRGERGDLYIILSAARCEHCQENIRSMPAHTARGDFGAACPSRRSNLSFFVETNRTQARPNKRCTESHRVKVSRRLRCRHFDWCAWGLLRGL